MPRQPQQPYCRPDHSGTSDQGSNPERRLHRFDRAISARPELAKVAQGNGALSFVPDGDGVVRRVPLVLQLAGEPVPTLVAETLRVAQGERNYVLRTQGSDIGLEGIRIGQFRIPTTAEGETLGALLARGGQPLPSGLEGSCRDDPRRDARRPAGGHWQFRRRADGPPIQSARPHHARCRSARPGPRTDSFRPHPAAPGLGPSRGKCRHHHRRVGHRVRRHPGQRADRSRHDSDPC
jgi:hypothetical protein